MNDHLSKPVLEAALWRVLLRWLVPGPAPAPQHPLAQAPLAECTAEAIDPAPLQELRTLFSAARLEALVGAFVQDCQQRVRSMEAAAALCPPDWATLQRQAHSLGGTAGSFGLHQVGTRAQALERAAGAHDAAAAVQLVQRIAQDAAHGLAQLQALCSAAADTPAA